MSDYDDLVEDDEAEAKAVPISKPGAPSSHCPRWMYHRPDVYCHTCGRMGEKAVKGVSLHLDLPPGGNVRSDFKKPKEKKGKK